jgi:hypothetical protein
MTLKLRACTLLYRLSFDKNLRRTGRGVLMHSRTIRELSVLHLSESCYQICAGELP